MSFKRALHGCKNKGGKQFFYLVSNISFVISSTLYFYRYTCIHATRVSDASFQCRRAQQHSTAQLSSLRPSSAGSEVSLSFSFLIFCRLSQKGNKYDDGTGHATPDKTHRELQGKYRSTDNRIVPFLLSEPLVTAERALLLMCNNSTVVASLPAFYSPVVPYFDGGALYLSYGIR